MPAKHLVQLSLQRKPNRHQGSSGSGQDPLSTQLRGAAVGGSLGRRPAVRLGPVSSASLRAETIAVVMQPGRGSLLMTRGSKLSAINVTRRWRRRPASIASIATVASGGLAYDVVSDQPDKSILAYRIASTHPGMCLAKRLATHSQLGRTRSVGLAHDWQRPTVWGLCGIVPGTSYLTPKN